jgi:drug/metabolite transporter (DMT)-like permease
MTELQRDKTFEPSRTQVFIWAVILILSVIGLVFAYGISALWADIGLMEGAPQNSWTRHFIPSFLILAFIPTGVGILAFCKLSKILRKQ